MNRALLDINVLLALLDSDHVDHRRAQSWLEDGSPRGGHHVRSPRMDVYLLALAAAHGGRLVTLDRAVPITSVRGATEQHLTVLPI